MMRSIIVLFEILLIFNFLTLIICKSSYTVSAPGTIRSNRKYTVSATLHNVSQPVKFLIGIRHNFTLSDNKTVLLHPMETKLVHFFPPKLDTKKTYEFFVEGIQGLYFFNKTEIFVGETEGVDINVETDRGSYRPGDLLQFRVVILDEHARPAIIKEPIKVQIFDSLGNRVKQYKDISFHRGVHSNIFQLSKDPVLGSWSLKVFIAGRYAQEKTVQFEVAKYILPKFFVNIETDSSIVYGERFLNIIVYGRYTYNKLVDGKVELSIKKSQIGFTSTYEVASYAADTVNSKAFFEIDLNDIVRSTVTSRLIISASLIEKQTGIAQSTTTEIPIHMRAHNITLLDNEVEYKDGNPFRIKIKVEHWNSTAVNDTDGSVFMTIGKNTSEAKLNENGVVVFENEFDIKMPVYISYKTSNKTFYLPTIASAFAQINKCYMRLKNKSSQMNLPIDVIVESERNIPYLIYMLTAHGNIVKSEFVHVEQNRKSYTIQLWPSNEMVPLSFLYVHYVYAGYLCSCEIEIILPDKLENEISVSAPRDVKPGENITMTLNAQPDSRVAITAVDLSSMLVNVGNRIKKSDIIHKMLMDMSYTKYSYVSHPGTTSGLITLTDIPYSAVRYFTLDSIPTKSDEIENKIRSYFPETWIFLDLNVTSEVTKINFTLPDTITTWILSAFSMNDKTGIGLLDADVRITASKPFFISTHLPYSIKRGEIVSILIVVFNYHSECLSTEVLMENKLNEFRFVDDLSGTMKNSSMERRNIIVPANDGKSVNFLIKAQTLGHINIIVQAKNKLSTDKVLQKLLVEPNGIETSHNHELYIHLKPGEHFTTRYKPNIPAQIESDTEFLQLSVGGDIILPAWDNLDNLVDMPTGCGEQNMVHFAPNILVLEYLSAIEQGSKYTELAVKAQQYTEIGYQQQLKFRHSNGGYSVFGPEGSQIPSNWLTAYVVRFFIKAKVYLSIENKIIDSSLNFLADRQLTSGEFENSGFLFDKAYKSKNSFTAFVLLSFLESPKYSKKYKNVIQKGLNFLSGNINEVNDIYSLALMSSVFQIAKHEKASEILDKVKPLAKTKNGLQWWQDDKDGGTTAVEITSYILLALMHKPGYYLPVIKWLIEQRNNRGGFKSTQDTVVGLQALTKYAQLSTSQNDTIIKVLYKAFGEKNEDLVNGFIHLDPTTAESLQHYQLPPTTRTIDIEISGNGNIFLQFSYNYRSSVDGIVSLQQSKPQSLIIKSNAESKENGLQINLETCIRYKPLDDANYLNTNMIIAEVDLPSGYIANEKSLRLLRSSEDVDRIEGETKGKVIFYLTYMQADEEKCIDLVADNKHDVRNLKPSKIVVYEYYHSDHREVVTYQIKSEHTADSY